MCQQHVQAKPNVGRDKCESTSGNTDIDQLKKVSITLKHGGLVLIICIGSNYLYCTFRMATAVFVR